MINNDQIPISIIIPVSTDQKIFDCIQSIDINTETIIILNGNYDKRIEQKLKTLRNIKLYYLEKFNFSKIYNTGIKKAKYENVFFMDSDCIFNKGTLLKLYSNLKQHLIIKGRIVFSYNNFIQKIIARAREFTTSDFPNLFIPGAIFKKEVFEKVGLFNEKIKFTSDAEMETRIKNANIPWLFMPDINIIHAPLTIKQDLKSAFRYGSGRSQKHTALNTTKSKSLIQEFYYYFVIGQKHKGFLTALYLVLWWICFTLGFYSNQVAKLFRSINNE